MQNVVCTGSVSCSILLCLVNRNNDAMLIVSGGEQGRCADIIIAEQRRWRDDGEGIDADSASLM